MVAANIHISHEGPSMPEYPLPCQIMFGEERGDAIRAQLEESIGQPCPCILGEPCMLGGRQEPQAV